MNFLFWNIQKKKETFEIIRKLILSEDIDILLLAEFPECPPEELLLSLNTEHSLYKYEHVEKSAPYDKVEIFTRFSALSIVPLKDTKRLSAKKFFSPLLEKDITIITCHLPSKATPGFEKNQSEYAEDVKDFIDEVEKQAGHKRTIMCGDFNMDPFEEGVIKAKGLHAINNKAIAVRNIKRTVNAKEYHLFYNPMWKLYNNEPVPGTHYYNSSNYINYYWHIYDQIIMRPELVNCFNEDALRIITGFDNSLLTPNHQIDKKYSDHLPIKFNFKI